MAQVSRFKEETFMIGSGLFSRLPPQLKVQVFPSSRTLYPRKYVTAWETQPLAHSIEELGSPRHTHTAPQFDQSVNKSVFLSQVLFSKVLLEVQGTKALYLWM